MNPEVKRKWLAALRSGEYTQGREMLHPGDDYCCLGVLCDLYIRENPRDAHWVDVGGPLEFVDDFSDTTDVYDLPSAVVDWAEIDADSEVITPVSYVDEGGKREQAYSLVALNDYARFDFNQIADVIEQQL